MRREQGLIECVFLCWWCYHVWLCGQKNPMCTITRGFYRLNLQAVHRQSTPTPTLTHTLSLAMAHNDVGGVGAGPSSSDVDEKDVYVRMRGAPPTSAPSSANLISGDAAAAPPPPKPRTAAFATSNPQFGNNRIATTKYSCLNFLPRSLFEQYVLVVIMCGCMGASGVLWHCQWLRKIRQALTLVTTTTIV